MVLGVGGAWDANSDESSGGSAVTVEDFAEPETAVGGVMAVLGFEGSGLAWVGLGFGEGPGVAGVGVEPFASVGVPLAGGFEALGGVEEELLEVVFEEEASEQEGPGGFEGGGRVGEGRDQGW